MKRSWFQAAVLVATLILFLITNTILRDSLTLSWIPPLIAAFIVVEIVVFVGLEVKEGTEKHGWKHEIVDTIIALLMAVVIWYGASFVLNTSTPVSGVVSCSMLPNLQRGDFVVVQGAPVRAYDIEMTRAEFDSINDLSSLVYNGQNLSFSGSLFSYCIRNKPDDLCRAFIRSPENFVERKGAFTYKYARCPITLSNGTALSEPCLGSILFRGKEYLTNFSNDVIIYQPPQSDLYSLVGDIVHRTFFVITVDGERYYVTRGDNNPILDIQVYDYGSGKTNMPVPQSNVRGKVILRIPLLGYFKLFISGYLDEDPQCKTQLEFEHVN